MKDDVGSIMYRSLVAEILPARFDGQWYQRVSVIGTSHQPGVSSSASKIQLSSSNEATFRLKLDWTAANNSSIAQLMLQYNKHVRFN